MSIDLLDPTWRNGETGCVLADALDDLPIRKICRPANGRSRSVEP
jgi:hypothetical protein